MLQILRITSADLKQALSELTDRARPQRIVEMPIRQSRASGTIEWLAARRTDESAQPDAGKLRIYSLPEQSESLPEGLQEPSGASGSQTTVMLGVGSGSNAGQMRLTSWQTDPLQGHPFSALQVVGTGFRTIPLNSQPRIVSGSNYWEEDTRSRTVGAIGMAACAALKSARIAVIGAGGNGSLMAEHLARLMGAEGKLALIDPDILQTKNLPTWALPPTQSMARPTAFKADVLADALSALNDGPEILRVTESVLDWHAMAVIKQMDMIACCVDNPTARFAASFLAALYARPLLDVATGVFLGSGPEMHREIIRKEQEGLEENSELFYHGALPAAILSGAPRTFGGDVRLIVPGRTDRIGNCLLCCGGVGDLAQVRKGLKDANSQADPVSRAFWMSRAGSLYTLNSEVVAFAVRMLTAYVARELERSIHWQMNAQLAAPAVWREHVHVPESACKMCSVLCLGDSGLGLLEQIAGP